MMKTRPPDKKLQFNPVSGEYEVDHWVAVCILGPKALIQIKRGKITDCGLFFNGTIHEVKTGATETLGGPWVAGSKGWYLNED